MGVGRFEYWEGGGGGGGGGGKVKNIGGGPRGAQTFHWL